MRLLTCLILVALLLSAFPPKAWSAAPTVEVEPAVPHNSALSDIVTASVHGRKLTVKVRHKRGIGRARLLLKGLDNKSLKLEVRFYDFVMLEGFTAYSGSKEVYTLANSRGKKRKFYLQICSVSDPAAIDLSWVDAYRH